LSIKIFKISPTRGLKKIKIVMISLSFKQQTGPLCEAPVGKKFLFMCRLNSLQKSSASQKIRVSWLVSMLIFLNLPVKKITKIQAACPFYNNIYSN